MEHMRCSKSRNWYFRLMPVLIGMRPLTKYFAYKMEENRSASEHVIRMSEYYNHLNQVGVNLPDKIVIDRIL